MTKEQILKLDNLSVAEEKPGMFVHIHAKEGYKITSWNENDNIINYTSSICMYMPIRDIYDAEYRVITDAEDVELTARQAVAIEKEMKSRNE